MLIKTDNIYDNNYNFFVALGLGSVQTGNKYKDFLHSFYRFFTRLTYLILLGTYFLDAYLVRHNSARLSMNMSLTVLNVTTFIKLCFVDMRHELFSKIRQNFNNNFMLPHIGKSDESRKITKKNSIHFLKLAKFLHVTFGFTSVLHFVLPLVLYFTKGIRKYPLPAPDSFGKASPNFELIYIAHVVMSIHFVWFLTTLDLITYEFEIRIADHFEILEENVNAVKKIYTNDRKLQSNFEFFQAESNWCAHETMKLMQRNIKHHQRILNQMEDINQVFSFPLFLQLTLGALKTSVLMFNAIIVSLNKAYFRPIKGVNNGPHYPSIILR